MTTTTTPKTPATPKEIRDKFIEDSNKFKANSYKSHVINSLSEQEKEAVKVIAGIADTVGGTAAFNKLVSAYNYIVQSE